MARVIKTAESMISPLGFSTKETLDAVLAGKSGVAKRESCFGVDEPSAMSLLDREKVFETASEYGITGYNFFETLSILAAAKCLKNSGIDPASERVLFVLSTIKGNVEALGVDEDSVPLPVSAERIARFFGNKNVPVTVSNACISGLSAMIHARRLLLSGVCDYAIVIGCECQSRFIFSGFQSLKALSPEPCKPFDKERVGLNVGEAAAAVLLCRNDDSSDAWELVCGAVRNDANHISGPSRTGEGSFKALNYCLKNCSADELAFVNVHGTSTAYNDEMESIALDRAGLSAVPINSLKGCFGHTMGAAGVLESLLSMRAVEEGVVLPTKGFNTLGVSHPVNISNEVRKTDKSAFIKLLSGFGGCNAAMLFRKGGER